MPVGKLKIKPEPDFSRLEKVLLRQGLPDRVPFFELLSNIELQVLQHIGRFRQTRHSAPGSADEEFRLIQQQIDYMYYLGYDYISLYPKNFDFPRNAPPKAVTAFGEREYHTADFHTISCRRDFDNYPWPDPSELDYSNFEQAVKVLPEGMKIIASFSGVLENVMWLLGYKGTSYLLYEDEQLIEDMFAAVGSRIVAYYDNVGSLEAVGALLLGDDMGFKTQTLLQDRHPRWFRHGQNLQDEPTGDPRAYTFSDRKMRTRRWLGPGHRQLSGRLRASGEFPGHAGGRIPEWFLLKTGSDS